MVRARPPGATAGAKRRCAGRRAGNANSGRAWLDRRRCPIMRPFCFFLVLLSRPVRRFHLYHLRATLGHRSNPGRSLTALFLAALLALGFAGPVPGRALPGPGLAAAYADNQPAPALDTSLSTVFVGSMDGVVYALDGSTGQR